MVRSTRTNCGLIVRAQRSWSSPPAASRPLRSTAPTGGMYLRLRRLSDCCANRELGTLEADVGDVRRPAQKRERGGVVARCKRRDLRDAGSARIGEELGGDRRADAAVLMRVGDGEGGLRAPWPGAREPGERGRLRGALPRSDERRMAAGDRRRL